MEEKELLLREDRRLLGRLLGEVIRSQAGEEALERIERIRQTAVRFRKEDQASETASRGELERELNLLDPEQTRASLRCDGDLRLGRAVGFPDLEVGLRGDEKHHIPRHTLVVGTTGAGKSTSMAGLIEKLASAGFCVLVVDVEAIQSP